MSTKMWLTGRLFQQVLLVSIISSNLFAFQNCGGEFKAIQASEFASSSIQKVPACSPTQSEQCQENNGFGVRFCNEDGSPKSCIIESCQSGFTLVNGSCVANACTANSTSACVEGNGSGLKTCNAAGTGFGSCVLNACNSGFNLSNGQCVANSCSPNTTTNCIANNGSGTMTCNAQGTGYGSCVITTCLAGFNLQNGNCVPNACVANSTTVCTELNGTGTKTCNSTGTGFGACLLNSCSSGFNLQNGVCVANACTAGSKLACTALNGTGSQTCNAQGSGYGACQLSSCNAGFNLQNGVCIANACTAGSMTACSENNGSGLKTCNASGTGFGACVLSSCATGFNLQNGVCVANACTPGASMACTANNGSGTSICNPQGTGYGACTLNKCNTGFNLQNGQCVANACTPSSTADCSENNGTGKKTCDASGTGFGSCQLSACSTGYNLQGGVCVLNVCTPNAVEACSVANGVGQRTCNATGTVNGACVAKTCSTGYDLVNGSCVATAQACQPGMKVPCFIGGGTGYHTCNADGQGFGSCLAESCDSPNVLSNGKCFTSAGTEIPDWVCPGSVSSYLQINEVPTLSTTIGENTGKNCARFQFKKLLDEVVSLSTDPWGASSSFRRSNGDLLFINQYHSGFNFFIKPLLAEKIKGSAYQASRYNELWLLGDGRVLEDRFRFQMDGVKNISTAWGLSSCYLSFSGELKCLDLYTNLIKVTERVVASYAQSTLYVCFLVSGDLLCKGSPYIIGGSTSQEVKLGSDVVKVMGAPDGIFYLDKAGNLYGKSDFKDKLDTPFHLIRGPGVVDFQIESHINLVGATQTKLIDISVESLNVRSEGNIPPGAKFLFGKSSDLNYSRILIDRFGRARKTSKTYSFDSDASYKSEGVTTIPDNILDPSGTYIGEYEAIELKGYFKMNGGVYYSNGTQYCRLTTLAKFQKDSGLKSYNSILPVIHLAPKFVYQGDCI